MEVFVLENGWVVFLDQLGDVTVLILLEPSGTPRGPIKAWSIVQIHDDEIFVSEPLIQCSSLAHAFVARENYVITAINALAHS